MGKLLGISVFNIYAITLVCIQDSPYTQGWVCYSGVHLLYFTVALVGFLQFLGQYLLFKYLLIDINPFRQNSLSAPLNSLGYFHLFLKCFLAFYITVDYSLKTGRAFVVMVTLFTTLFLILRY